ncbi:cyclic GMP-AMP synthase-like receptor isoform X1 [Plodia interpunctella]|uniref:cyclic GMP-AMP synthase-like receptor isoform X1 n=1 Tax=Plodia interpunctella TaxID=58824 RepID=UPI0023680102|nr:cyclic GMP-AMP synthase-like receptor isoform X1 [Plodia interpunctella]
MRHKSCFYRQSATVGAGLAVAAGGLYLWANRSSNGNNQTRETTQQSTESSSSTSSYLSGLMNRVNMSGIQHEAHGIPEQSIPEIPHIINLDTLLHDIYLRYIALKRHDFSHHYRVFDTIFLKMHRTMQRVDRYYQKYSSTVQVSGSHYDRLRIKKPDEFDIDIFIGLPLNIKSEATDASKSDIILESMAAGFVKLKMGTQFQKLPYRDDWEVNKTLFSWRNDEYYLLRSKFSDWFKSLVYRALNEFECIGNLPMCYVDSNAYVIGTSEAGPAVTLKIKCLRTNFKMDVDLVPVLKFPEDRWPADNGYRKIPELYRDEIFMVVPKPIKGKFEANDVSKSWRMSLIYQERRILHNTHNLRQTIRFLKKLRDTFDMYYIASYYIKTLFFWEVHAQRDPAFWRQANSKLFKIMVTRLHAALTRRHIPYFWNESYNLIEGAPDNVVAGHVAKLAKLLRILDNPLEYKKVAEFLLTPSEFADYSKFL